MKRVYEELEKERFKTLIVDGREQIEIPARRNWFVLLFLMFWLTMWTFGGIAAIISLLSKFSLFVIFWLCGWAVAWIFVAATISWQLTGRELVSTVGMDLELGHQMFGLKRMKLYRGSDILKLMVDAPGNSMFNFQFSVPFYHGANFGKLKFDYGAKTFRFGSGVEEAEARTILAKIAPKIPSSATAP
jgi:hypothetical protein